MGEANSSTSPNSFKVNFDAGQMWLNDSVNATGSGQDFYIMEDVNWNNEYIIESGSGYIDLDFGEEITITEILMRVLLV